MNKQFSYLYFLLFIGLFYSCSDQKGFEFIPANRSNIDFNNFIPEDKNINILNFEYLYNGGGVGAADFNKDGQIDLYFAGNMVNNRLFLNKEGFEFTDVTEISGTAAANKWSNGISIVDINEDTWPDIYVSVSSLSSAAQPKNLLFINQGNNDQGIPTFIEAAEKYGIASTKHSRHAAFFDYDRDGDLDLYVLNNIIDLADPTSYRRKVTNGTASNNDQLYQNQGNNQYKEVSKAAGILIEGYGLGVAIGDINKDGWPDIYVANDYISNDLLYINQQDGTFKNEIGNRTKLQSKFSMGVSLADFNNDGASDILVLDMLSATNDRLKRHVKESNYNNRRNNQVYKYQEQVARNTFQQNDGSGYFGEIGFHAGIYASDWSWSPLTADFNNDGLLDVYVTNGYPKDITELDFVDYRAGANLALNKKKLFDKLTAEKVPNCLFLNQGDMRFKEQAKTWELDKPSFSNGAIYADFDQNGQLDIVVNNINENAYLLKNNGFEQPQNYLQIQFSAATRYSKAIGAKIYVHANGQQQFQEYHLNKSYLSSVSPFLHFGLGTAEKVDSIIVQWPRGAKTKVAAIAANQIYTLADPKTDNRPPPHSPQRITQNAQLLITPTPLIHQDTRQNDFSYQRTLPISYSHLGSVVAVADLDDNEQKAIVSIAGSQDFIKIFHPENGQIDTLKGLITKGVNGLLVADMNQNGLQDIVVTYGGYNVPDLNASTMTQHHFEIFLNKGNLNFESDIKIMFSSTDNPSLGVIRGEDIDKDGDIDLFLGGTVSQNNFPMASHSYLWINDLKVGLKNNKEAGTIDLLDLGIVMDALWTDVDDDGKKELMVAAHLKPIQIISFENGQLSTYNYPKITATGFWNSIQPLDYDNDGDTDYLVANLGTNTPLSNGNSPITITYQDQDENGSVDVFTGFRFNQETDEVPFEFRNEVIAQIPILKKQFLDYQSYATTSFDQFVQATTNKTTPKKIIIETVAHQLLKNENGQLTSIPLPTATQLSPIFGWTTTNVNEDKRLDVIASTNLSYSREFWGTYAALDGLFLLGQSDSTHFKTLTNAPKLKGDGRAIVSLLSGNQRHHFMSVVNAPMQVIQTPCSDCVYYTAQPNEQTALITFKDGTQRKVEFYYGQGFRAQSERGVLIDKMSDIAEIEILTAEDKKMVLDMSSL